VTCARCGVDQAVHPQLGCVGGFVWQRARLPVGTPLATEFMVDEGSPLEPIGEEVGP
jgi:hypothetical protein